jgi:hypothetical protein
MKPTATLTLTLMALVSISACQGDVNQVGTMPSVAGSGGSGKASTTAVGGLGGEKGLGGSRPTGGTSGTSVSGASSGGSTSVSPTPTGGTATLGGGSATVATGGAEAIGGNSAATTVARGGASGGSSASTTTGGALGGSSASTTSGRGGASGGSSASTTSGRGGASGGAAATGGTGGQAGSRAAGGTGGSTTTIDGVTYVAYYDVNSALTPPRETLIVVKNDANRRICAVVALTSQPTASSYRVTVTAPNGWGGGDGELGMATGVCEIEQEGIPVYSASSGSAQVSWQGTKPCVIDVEASLTFPVDPKTANPSSESLSVRGLVVNGC